MKNRRWLAAGFALAACGRPTAHEPVRFDARAHRPPASYDPLARAAASIGKLENPDPTIPPVCYTRTAAVSNPCAACHTHSTYPNLSDDWALQQNYSFPESARTNHWRNLFRHRRALVAGVDDDELLAYVRTDNYGPLREALAARPATPVWRPDVDLAAGFDDDGFARDGTGWRALRYKPFPGTFWPTNGSADDVYIRLPDAFQRDRNGRGSRAVYQINLAILEAAIAGDPRPPDAELVREVEPLDETAAGIDLDRDGALGTATRVVGLPAVYAGGAGGVAVVRGLYPAGVELLHTVRYLDPDAPAMTARRAKEVRYARKLVTVEGMRRADVYTGFETGDVPPFTGDPLTGMRNELGWMLQGWIEDEQGWLRLQTHEEQAFCMGCHGNIGVTADTTFSFARKVPGRGGWRVQDPRGIPDRPQVGQSTPEFEAYLARVGAGDELRANTEMLARYFPGGALDRAAVAATRDDVGALILPSRARALALDRAYLANVLEQTYVWGRDPVLAPVDRVHAVITGDPSTGLGEAGRVVRDGGLHLDW